jgi:hypothetical protein
MENIARWTAHRYSSSAESVIRSSTDIAHKYTGGNKDQDDGYQAQAQEQYGHHLIVKH